MTAIFFRNPPGKYDALMNGWNEPSKHGNGNVFAFNPCTEGGGEAMTQNKADFN